MNSRFMTYMLAVSLAMVVSCSKIGTRTDIDHETESTDPMRFSTPEENHQAETKASSPLTQGFLVSSWKAFGKTGQHVVMDKYEVQYKYDSWQGSSHWGYVSGGSDTFYQTQYERYWDYSNFPYRFYAISPCPPYSEMSSFVLSDTKLVLPESVIFGSQTSADGVLSDVSEPYMPAQILRDGNGHDFDLIAKDPSGDAKEINLGSTLLNRSVSLPFHHLTSKVRFGFYVQDFGESGPDPVLIRDIEVKVVSDGFTASAKGYSADLSSSDMLGGEFSSRTKTDSHPVLLTVQDDNGTANDLRFTRSRSTAYMCKASSGLLQIPQDAVRMRVSFKVSGQMIDTKTIEAYSGQIYYDSINDETVYTDLLITVRDADDNKTDTFSWGKNTLNSYYVVLSRFYPLSVEFTASLTSWEDVNGALDTDLEK